jgi:hypothetical protein
VTAGHAGGCVCLIDKHQALRIEAGLTGKPVLPLSGYRRTLLLDCMACLFLRVIPQRTKKR